MEDWMSYDAMWRDVFKPPGAYPYPFGSTSLGILREMSDAAGRRLPYPRLRDQAVSVDEVFAEWKGRYLALWEMREYVGMSPYHNEGNMGYLDDQLTTVCLALRRIQVQQQRLRPLLDAAKQPWYVWRN